MIPPDAPVEGRLRAEIRAFAGRSREQARADLEREASKMVDDMLHNAEERGLFDRRTVADRLQTTTTRNPPKFIGMGVGATGAARTAAVTDTALSTEVETRATGTESIATVSVTSDTYQIVGTITATAARVVDEAGSFDASTVGNMATSFTFAVVNLNNGDSIQFTIRLRAG
jgi:hypothetical protein